MGRATHNKHTQSANVLKNLSLSANIKTLSSNKDLKNAFEPQRIISHSDAILPISSISDIYKSLSDFSLLSQKIVSWYDENELIIKNQDQLAIDMLHEIELSPPKDLWRAYKCYAKLRESRQKRRKAKSENKMLLPLYNYIKSNPTLPKDMRLICERCAGAQYDIEHSSYSFRSNLDVD